MVSVSGVFRPRPTYLHNTNLDLNSVQELPDSHIWPALDAEASGNLTCVESMPVIDLADPDVVGRMGHASETWGGFHVTGHGVPLGLIDRLESQVCRLFSLPREQKLNAARVPNSFNGYGQVPIAAFFEKSLWSEGCTITDSPVNWASRLWPDDYIEFCDVMEEYKKEMKALCVRIMWLMLASLGITKKDLDWAGPNGDFDGSWTTLQLNWYPPCPDPNRAIGLVAHSDSPILTVLYPSSTSGLQVLREHGTQAHWVTIGPVPDSFVVNVGDLLQILTNGRFRAPLHRAIVNRTHHRLSVPIFIGPPKDALITPLSKLVSADRPQLYRAVTWDEYLGIKRKYFQDALAVVSLRAPMDEPSNVSDHGSLESG
ncbi:gibberellin 3-beta-dioxygenase 1-like protein [Cinnamomum micranthum f. kanehirae]|uniref:gibberellin 3beta-dioxygenase n=1 Tax=Cinnamomum micranthum f. kanehirae TaxID=337451 RepID=A0A3S3PBT4_9MAGN|nr:gibberellin 3-beta-dioxygenase 1-like protein [Cinnamomum micranthum f. kanehirae]